MVRTSEKNRPQLDTDGLSVDAEFYFQWHITQGCNRRCAHCYHSDFRTTEDLQYSSLLHIADKMLQALEAWDKLGSFSLTGGEPFMKADEVFGLVDRLSEHDRATRIDVLTNGSLVTDELCEEISKRPL